MTVKTSARGRRRDVFEKHAPDRLWIDFSGVNAPLWKKTWSSRADIAIGLHFEHVRPEKTVLPIRSLKR
ncbi:hypothetical protein ABZ851_30460 [Streptomyces sp. NPDC047049]|uniref:hypothetical protein n=1 Tax=Streptomyces sp. NPDC047049 TaxID=3156688 RepID=UPI0033CE4F1C